GIGRLKASRAVTVKLKALPARARVGAVTRKQVRPPTSEGSTSKGWEAPAPRAEALANSVYPTPGRLTDRSVNVAIPPRAITVVVPRSAAPLGLLPRATLTRVSPPSVTRLPNASSTRTVTGGWSLAPTTVVAGCAPKASWNGAVGVTVTTALPQRKPFARSR